MARLALIRHGQSQWNLENRFTGWVDVDLTERGRAEAKKAGDLLKASGVEFSACFTSVQKRAIRTSATMAGLPASTRPRQQRSMARTR